MRRLMRLTQRQKTLLRTAPAVMAGLAIAGGVAWAWLSGAAQQTWEEASVTITETTADAATLAGMRLRQITVEGRERTSGSDIVGAIDMAQGGPLMSIDPAATRERLESLPWVKEATVERRLPDTIHVRLVERTPIAVWQRGPEDFALIDADGTVIENKVGAFADLTVIAGKGAPEAASDLFTMLAAAPGLSGRVRAAVRVGQRRWDLWFDGIGEAGIAVRLPEFGAADALTKLAAMEREQAILERDLAAIDLRLPGKLIVQLTNEAAEREKEAATQRAKAGRQSRSQPQRGSAQDA